MKTGNDKEYLSGDMLFKKQLTRIEGFRKNVRIPRKVVKSAIDDYISKGGKITKIGYYNPPNFNQSPYYSRAGVSAVLMTDFFLQEDCYE